MTSDGTSDALISEPDGTPLSAGWSVLRLGPQPSINAVNDPGHTLLASGKAWPGLFAFSSTERIAEGQGLKPRLSVWTESLTTLHQAWLLVGGNPNNRIALTLFVDLVRAISAPDMPGVRATPRLDVVWERAVRPAPDGTGSVPDDRPGSKGHCGIDGLCNGTKAQKGKLRELLAESVPPNGLVVLTDDQIASFRLKPSA